MDLQHSILKSMLVLHPYLHTGWSDLPGSIYFRWVAKSYSIGCIAVGERP